jgi:hypothetical protein
MVLIDMRDELSDKLPEYNRKFERPFPAGMAASGRLSRSQMIEIVQRAIDSGKPLVGPTSDVIRITVNPPPQE